MRIVLQRVKFATVSVEGTICARIGKGILIFVGVDKDDTPIQAEFLASKCAAIRIFPDSSGKMNLSPKEVAAQALVVSQFTLLADCSKGNRPSYSKAAEAEKAKKLYETFIQYLKKQNLHVETGIFGAMMDVELINDGPVTLILEK